MIVGDDRADLIDTMNKLFGKTVQSVNGEILGRGEMESYKNLCVSELSNLDIPDMLQNNLSAFSASFVRNLVSNCLRDKFVQVYTPYLSQELIHQLYREINEGFDRAQPIKQGKKRKTCASGGGKRQTATKKSKKHKKNTRKSTRKYSRKRH